MRDDDHAVCLARRLPLARKDLDAADAIEASFRHAVARSPAEPFVETDAPEARFAEWDERALLDAAARVSGLGIASDATRVTAPLQVTADDFAERRSFRAGDLDDAVSRCSE